jgi:hypothetical protein
MQNNTNPATVKHTPVSRRQILKIAGVCIALPWMESARLAQGAGRPGGAGTVQADSNGPPMRMVLSWYGLGFHTNNLFPTQTGSGYETSRYLKHFDGLRQDMTVISKLHQEGRRGGHGVKSYAWRGIPEGNYLESLDVFAGQRVGKENRFPSLCIGQGGGGGVQSYMANGVPVSPYKRASEIFAALFIDETGAAKVEAMTRIRQGYSILDNVRQQARAQKRQLNAAYTRKMDQYLEAIRQSERDLKRNEEWAAIPKPQTKTKPPKDIADKSLFIGQAQQIYDMIYLALASDSTRIVGNIVGNYNVVPQGIKGVDGDHHVLTHHGMVEEKIRQLSLIEDAEMKVVAAFLKKLKETPDGDGTMLDHTMVCIGSESNDLSRHASEEVPIILAGGSFKQGQFLKEETLVQNLYLTMLHQLGVENDSWGNSTGTLSELG